LKIDVIYKETSINYRLYMHSKDAVIVLNTIENKYYIILYFIVVEFELKANLIPE